MNSFCLRKSDMWERPLKAQILKKKKKIQILAILTFLFMPDIYTCAMINLNVSWWGFFFDRY